MSIIDYLFIWSSVFMFYILISQPILLLSTMQKKSQSQEMEAQFQPIIFFEPFEAPQLSMNPISVRLNQLAYLQYQMNQQLLVNKILTDKYLVLVEDRKWKNLSSEASTLQLNHQIAPKETKNRNAFISKTFNKNKQRKQTIKKDKYNCESEYEPSHQSGSIPEYKLSESKNAPKNFGSSILNFIVKNQVKAKKLLNHTGVDFQIFSDFVGGLKNKINTIAELRSLWLQSPSNPYSKIVRILSFQYLRRHSLDHIFNSRIENHGKHIKYRQKILKEIKKPQQFTQMKDF